MKRWLLAVGNWFDARLGVRATLLPMMRHPIPREVAGPMGWWYVFGSASLTLLLVQILTGIGLALVYVPSADKAYDSLQSLNHDQSLGWFLRALHYYAGAWQYVLGGGDHGWADFDAEVPSVLRFAGVSTTGSTSEI